MCRSSTRGARLCGRAEPATNPREQAAERVILGLPISARHLFAAAQAEHRTVATSIVPAISFREPASRGEVAQTLGTYGTVGEFLRGAFDWLLAFRILQSTSRLALPSAHHYGSLGLVRDPLKTQNAETMNEGSLIRMSVHSLSGSAVCHTRT